MASELYIFRCAKIMLDNHGDDAELHAAEKRDAMLSVCAICRAASQ